MKKLITLALVLMGFAGVARAASVDDLVVLKHSYVLVCDDWNNNGTEKIAKGTLFGDNHFFTPTGNDVGFKDGNHTKGSVDLSQVDALGEDGTPLYVTQDIVDKYGEYGMHYNSMRLKNNQDVVALKLTAKSKLIIFLQGNNKSGKDARIPCIAKSIDDIKNKTGLNAAPDADHPTTVSGFKWEYTVEDDGLYYIGSYNGDMFVSYIIVEANEAPGTPTVKVGDQIYEGGLWFREVTCKANPYAIEGTSETIPTIVTYTTDGSAPTATSQKYTEPIKCYQNMTVKFQAFMDMFGDGQPDEGFICDGADNEANVNFIFDAPTISSEGADVSIYCPYEGATNFASVDGVNFEETSFFTLTESATVTAYSQIVNGSYATFTTNKTTKDVYVLSPIKAAKTIAVVSADVVVDEEATATDPNGNTVYKVENGVISADKADFFVKNLSWAVLKDANAQYQVPEGQEAYIKMSDTNISFMVAEGDSVNVKVICTKNSCKNIDAADADDGSAVNDRKCYVTVNGTNYGGEDLKLNPDGNVIEFGLKGAEGGSIFTFQKYSGTGNILISSIEITPVAGQAAKEIADGKWYIRNVATKKFWGAGNTWGTQASLVDEYQYVTLAKQDDGAFTMETMVSNGGDNYYFNGDYMDNNQPLHLTIAAAENGYFTVANPSGELFGYDGTSTVLGKNIAAGENTLWEFLTEEEIVAEQDALIADAVSKATVENPVELTNVLIKDANFGRNRRDAGAAWTMEASNQNLAGGGDNGNGCGESWHSVFTLSQVLSKAPMGVYKVTAQGFFRQDADDYVNLPYFYANDEKSVFPERTGTENSMADAGLSFKNGMYAAEPMYVKVSEIGGLTIGAKLENNVNLWAIWDNFQVEYYGPNANIDDVKPAQEDPELVAPEGWTSGITNGNLAGDDVSSYVSKEAPSADILGATIVAGAGKGGSRGIVVKSADSPSQAWDTQFWIVLDKPMKVGTKMHVQFDYKASKAAASNTQAHGAPGNYNHWACIGDVNFTTEWQTYSTDIEITGDMSKADNPMQSIAFNLAVETTATEYYFDNFGVWYQEPAPVAEWADIIVNGDMEGKDTQCFYVTEQGVGGPFLAKTTPGIGKDGGSAIKVQSADEPAQDWDTQFFIRFPYQLPAGTKFRVSFDYKADKAGAFDTQAHAEPGAYIHWAAIGSGNFTTEWQTYEAEGSVSSDMSKADNPMQTIAFNLAKNKVATEFIFDNVKFEIEKSVADGLTPNPAVNPTPYPEPVDPNELIVNGSLEGEDVVSFVSKEKAGDPFPSIITDGIGVDGSRGIKVTSDAGAAQDWDAQFWIVLPEPLEAGTEFHVEFDYKASMNAAADTQAHGVPSFYHHWMCIGSPSFTPEWQHFSADATVGSEWIGPNGEGDVTGFKSIAFNLSKDKANTVDFFFDNISVKLVVPEGITKVYNFTFDDDAIYNLRGQKVDASYKGIVIRNGRKVLQK